MTSSDRTEHDAGDPGSVESWLISAGRDRRPGSPLNVPPCPASNFVLGERRAYSRDDGTPSWEALEEIIGGPRGWFFCLHRLRHGGNRRDFRPTPHGLGGRTAGRLLPGCRETRQSWPKPWPLDPASSGGGQYRGLDRDVSLADLIWLESPSNPLLAVADPDAICAAPRKSGAILSVDNTFATPINQRRWRLGPTWLYNQRRSSLVDTRTCSAASSQCATRIYWQRYGRPGN